MATRLCSASSSFALYPAGGLLRRLQLPTSAGREAAAAAAASARPPLRRAPPLWRPAPLGGPLPLLPRVSFPTLTDAAAAPAAPAAGRVRMLAAPRKTLPKHTVRVYCAGCRALLYKYHKGGTGSLVKMYLERIAQDETTELGMCACGVTVARPATIHGRPKLII